MQVSRRLVPSVVVFNNGDRACVRSSALCASRSALHPFGAFLHRSTRSITSPRLDAPSDATLQEMRGALPKDIAVPASVALPFGTFERVLADGANKEAAAAVKAAQKDLVSPGT